MNIVYKLGGTLAASSQDNRPAEAFSINVHNWSFGSAVTHWTLADWCHQGPDLVAAICLVTGSENASPQNSLGVEGPQSAKTPSVLVFHAESPQELVVLAAPAGLWPNALSWRPPLDTRLFRVITNREGKQRVAEFADVEQSQQLVFGARSNWPRLLVLHGCSLWRIWGPHASGFRVNRWRITHEEECMWQLRDISWMPQLDLPLIGVCGLAANGEVQLWIAPDTEDDKGLFAVHTLTICEQRIILGQLNFINPAVSYFSYGDAELHQPCAAFLRSEQSSAEDKNGIAGIQTEDWRLVCARVVYATQDNDDCFQVCEIGFLIPCTRQSNAETCNAVQPLPDHVRIIAKPLGSICLSTNRSGASEFPTGADPLVPSAGLAAEAPAVPCRFQICPSTGDIFIVIERREVQRWRFDSKTAQDGLSKALENHTISGRVSEPSPSVDREHGLLGDPSWSRVGSFQHERTIDTMRLSPNSLFVLLGSGDATLTVLKGDRVAWASGSTLTGSLQIGPMEVAAMAIAPSPHAGCAFVLTNAPVEFGSIVQLPADHLDASFIAKTLCRMMQHREGATERVFDLITRIRDEPKIFAQIVKALEQLHAPRRCFTMLMLCHTLLTPLWLALNTISVPVRILESLSGVIACASHMYASADHNMKPLDVRLERLRLFTRPRLSQLSTGDSERMFCAAQKILCMGAAWIRHAALTTMLFMRADELPPLWAALRRQDWASMIQFIKHQGVASGAVDDRRVTPRDTAAAAAAMGDWGVTPDTGSATSQVLIHDFLRVSFHFVHDPYYVRLINIACCCAVAVLAELRSLSLIPRELIARVRLQFDLETGHQIAAAIQDLRDAWRGMDAELTLLLRTQRNGYMANSPRPADFSDAIRTRLDALKSAIHLHMLANIAVAQRLLENPHFALERLEDCAGMFGSSMRGFFLRTAPLRVSSDMLSHDAVTCMPLEAAAGRRRCSRTGLVATELEASSSTEDALLQTWRNVSPFGGVWYVDSAAPAHELKAKSDVGANQDSFVPSAADREPRSPRDGTATMVERFPDWSLVGNHRDVLLADLDDLGPDIDMRHVASGLRDEVFGETHRINLA